MAFLLVSMLDFSGVGIVLGQFSGGKYTEFVSNNFRGSRVIFWPVAVRAINFHWLVAVQLLHQETFLGIFLGRGANFKGLCCGKQCIRSIFGKGISNVSIYVKNGFVPFFLWGIKCNVWMVKCMVDFGGGDSDVCN